MEKPFACENQTKSGFSENVLVFLYVISTPLVGAPFLFPDAVKYLLVSNNAYYWLEDEARLKTMNSLCSLGSTSFLLSGVLGSYFINYINNRNTSLLATCFHILGWLFCFSLDKYCYYFPFIGMCLWGISIQLLSQTKFSVSVFYDSRKHLVLAMIGGSVGMSFAYMQLIVNIVDYFSRTGFTFPYFDITVTQFVVFINCLMPLMCIFVFYFIIPTQPFLTPVTDYCNRVSLSRSQVSATFPNLNSEERNSLVNSRLAIEVNRCKEDVPFKWTLTFKEQVFSVTFIGFTIVYSLLWFVRLYFTVNMKSILLNQTNGDIEYTDKIINIFGLSLGTTYIAAIIVGMFVDMMGIYLFLILLVLSSLLILLIFSSFTPFFFLSHLFGIVLCVFCYSYFIGCSFSFLTTEFGYTYLNLTQGISSTVAGLFTILYNYWDSYIHSHYKQNFLFPSITAIVINIIILLISVYIRIYSMRWNSFNSNYFFFVNKRYTVN
ncbi:protein with 12 transmembrane domains [Cryptosporidium ryanae]|uniref:protein with 12 transmembrane domains n=1 Tax=Cryptosporidium ryanae TaxID=515981 RepID=UPI00351A92B4|nr:protein with 12 transmembrane domains [Cryptosporidium ryanae]